MATDEDRVRRATNQPGLADQMRCRSPSNVRAMNRQDAVQ
jgi:hypothetical protein